MAEVVTNGKPSIEIGRSPTGAITYAVKVYAEVGGEQEALWLAMELEGQLAAKYPPLPKKGEGS